MPKLSRGCKIEHFRAKGDQGESYVAKTYAPWCCNNFTAWAVSKLLEGRDLPDLNCQQLTKLSPLLQEVRPVGGFTDKTPVPGTW